MKRFVTFLVVFLTIPVSYSFAGNTIDLSGQWQIALDREDVGMKQQWFATSLPGDDKVRLPGSLQEQGYGSKPSAQTVWTAGIGPELLKQKRFEPVSLLADPGSALCRPGVVSKNRIDPTCLEWETYHFVSRTTPLADNGLGRWTASRHPRCTGNPA